MALYIECGGPTTGFAKYIKPKNAWSCLGQNILTLESNTGDCGGWPASVTLTPV